MIIVALNNILPNDINNNIAKFIGIKPHPITKDLKWYIGRYQRRNRDKKLTFSKYTLNALHCIVCNCLLKGIMLKIGNEFCIKCDC